MFSAGWSEQGGISLSIQGAQAQPRLYVSPYHYYNPYRADAAGLPWYAVRAYYLGGPWSGPGWSYAGWDDYAHRWGIACTPGTIVHGGDGIDYVCQ
jgi:hypothetical protein